MRVLKAKLIPGRGRASLEVSKAFSKAEIFDHFCPGTANFVLTQPIYLEPKSAKYCLEDNVKRYFWEAKLNGRSVLLYRWQGSRLHTFEIVANFHIRSEFKLDSYDQVDLCIPERTLRKLRLSEFLNYLIFWSCGRQAWPYQREFYQRTVKWFELVTKTVQL